MGIVVDRHQGPAPGEDEIIALMGAECLAPYGWRNAPGDTYGWREHSYEKVLYCIRGLIVFRAGSSDADLGPGTGWCCHRIPRARPPSALKEYAASRSPARVRCGLAKQAQRQMRAVSAQVTLHDHADSPAS